MTTAEDWRRRGLVPPAHLAYPELSEIERELAEIDAKRDGSGDSPADLEISIELGRRSLELGERRVQIFDAQVAEFTRNRAARYGGPIGLGRRGAGRIQRWRYQ